MPMETVVEFSFLRILVLLLVVVGLVMLVVKLKGRGIVSLMLLLGGGLLVMWGTWGLASVDRPDSKAAVVYQDNGEFIRNARPESFEAIKEHFDRNLIPLDKEGSEEASEKSALSEDATEEPPQAPAKEKQSQGERPDWVDLPPKRIGNVYQVVVSTTSHPDMDACYQAVEQELNAAVRVRIGQLTDADYTPRPSRLGLTTNFILSDICNQRWIETTELSVGDWKRLHILMKFDAAVDDRLRAAMYSYQREDQIVGLGAAALGVVGLLALIYGLLQFDTYTRGYYTKRLFFGVPAAIIGVVLLIAAIIN